MTWTQVFDLADTIMHSGKTYRVTLPSGHAFTGKAVGQIGGVFFRVLFDEGVYKAGALVHLYYQDFQEISFEEVG